MAMSNFIDEAERHAEIYQDYTPRQTKILEIIYEKSLINKGDSELLTRLNMNQVSESEIHWLLRTGHYLPAYR